MAQGWVALLRGINLGSRNAVPMPKLRDVLSDAGCDDVRTYIRSGNVLFRKRSSSRAALARSLERAIADSFGVEAAVVLRTFDELVKVADSHPFGSDTSRSHVAFLASKPPAASVRAVTGLEIAPDRVEISGTEVFLLYPDGVQGSRLTGALLERHLGVPATIRNWRTVARLAAMTNDDG